MSWRVHLEEEQLHSIQMWWNPHKWSIYGRSPLPMGKSYPFVPFIKTYLLWKTDLSLVSRTQCPLLQPLHTALIKPVTLWQCIKLAAGGKIHLDNACKGQLWTWTPSCHNFQHIFLSFPLPSLLKFCCAVTYKASTQRRKHPQNNLWIS